MARVNVYLPDELADQAKEAGLNVSGLTQSAVRAALAAGQTDEWLDEVGRLPRTGVTHEDVIVAIAETRATTSIVSMADRLIVDASAMVDLLVGSPLARAVHDRLGTHTLHAPAHFDAEVMSALGRLHRAGRLSDRQTKTRLDRLIAAPVDRHRLPSLVAGAWRLRHNLRLVDALYVELAHQLDLPIVTTDAGMAAATPFAELLTRQG